MAFQKDIIKLEGTVGDLVFYKTNAGYLVRSKPHLNTKRIAQDPRYARTRENAAEFGRASSAAGLLRKALRPMLLNLPNKTHINRLNSRMLRVVKSDTRNARGERTVLDEKNFLLQHFAFNAQAALPNMLFCPIDTQINRGKNQVTLRIPAFTPDIHLRAPKTATHFQFSMAAVWIDFSRKEFTSAMKHTDVHSLMDRFPASPFELQLPMAANGTVFIVVGINFFGTGYSGKYPLAEPSFQAVDIVGVEENSGRTTFY